jgi:hypothetical protein
MSMMVFSPTLRFIPSILPLIVSQNRSGEADWVTWSQSDGGGGGGEGEQRHTMILYSAREGIWSLPPVQPLAKFVSLVSHDGYATNRAF